MDMYMGLYGYMIFGIVRLYGDLDGHGMFIMFYGIECHKPHQNFGT
jgi:hypothetical protein